MVDQGLSRRVPRDHQQHDSKLKKLNRIFSISSDRHTSSDNLSIMMCRHGATCVKATCGHHSETFRQRLTAFQESYYYWECRGVECTPRQLCMVCILHRHGIVDRNPCEPPPAPRKPTREARTSRSSCDCQGRRCLNPNHAEYPRGTSY